MHSNWLIKIWTDDNIQELNFDNGDIFDKADNYGVKSDILIYLNIIIIYTKDITFYMVRSK
jgi:hypothetical protein